MPRFKVAHVVRDGAGLIIVPVSRSFGRKSAEEQGAIVGELRARAAAAGLAGNVIPVWDAGAGRMQFLAPQGLHPLFKDLDLPRVLDLVNRELSW
jgi:hypothetical protein